MNAMNDSKLIEESFCSITEAIFKILPKNNLPFSLYRMNPSNGRFTPITIPGKAIISADKQSISDDCERGLIFIKFRDIGTCKPFFMHHLPTVISDISHSIPEHELASLLLEGLKKVLKKYTLIP